MRSVEAVTAHEGGAAEHDLVTVDRAQRTLAGGGVEIGHLREDSDLVLGGRHHGLGQRVLRGSLNAGREPEELVGLEPLRGARLR